MERTIPKVGTVAGKKSSARVDWEDLRVLVELARQGSLSATARSLGVTHVTVSRRIANLEADLDQVLFVRENGRYVLTDAGKRVHELAGPMAGSADAIVRAASGLQPHIKGPVRVTATEAVATYVVVPALRNIHVRYPDLDLELRVTQINLNLARNDADIAVRLAKPEDTSLWSVKAARLDYYLYGARTYVDGRKPDALEYIGYTQEFANWLEYQTLETIASGRRLSLRCNHLGNRIAAARQGLGLALLPAVMAETYPDLVCVTKGKAPMHRDAHIVVHNDLRQVPRVKVCCEALIQSIATLNGSAR
jgi:DNA-binding transcriptional LysR family regulator